MYLNCLQRGCEGEFVNKLLGLYSVLVTIGFFLQSSIEKDAR